MLHRHVFTVAQNGQINNVTCCCRRLYSLSLSRFTTHFPCTHTLSMLLLQQLALERANPTRLAHGRSCNAASPLDNARSYTLFL